MVKMTFEDTIKFADLANGGTRTTKDGYLVCMPRVARTGIQVYRGSEVGKPELDQVRVYRPHEQVFHKDSVASFSCKPITNDHPPDHVNAANWRQFAVGMVGEDVMRDGEMIRVPMTLMDAGVIRDYEAGKKEISVGYGCELKWEPGKCKDGEYDAIQTGILVNHVAVVDAARGGSKLAIGDDETEDTFTTGDDDMEIKTRSVMIDGLACVVADHHADILDRHVKKQDAAIVDLTAQLKAANDKIATVTTDAAKAADEAKKALETKDAEVVTVKKQLTDSALTPDKLDALVKDRSEVTKKAKFLLGDKLVVDGKSIADIRKQVVEAKLGDACKGWTDDQIAASFTAFTAGLKDEDMGDDRGAGGDRGNFSNDSGYSGQIANAFSRPGSQQMDDGDRAYGDRNNSLNDAWKPQWQRDQEAASRNQNSNRR